MNKMMSRHLADEESLSTRRSIASASPYMTALIVRISATQETGTAPFLKCRPTRVSAANTCIMMPWAKFNTPED